MRIKRNRSNALNSVHDFKDRLRSSRLAKGVRPRQLAEQLRISEISYVRFERGLARPSLQMFSRICMALDVTPNHLLGWDERERRR